MMAVSADYLMPRSNGPASLNVAGAGATADVLLRITYASSG